MILTPQSDAQRETCRLSREILRVLRHGGRLQAVHFDKPTSRREHTALWVGQHISDESAIRPHIDGSWTHAQPRRIRENSTQFRNHSPNLGNESAKTPIPAVQKTQSNQRPSARCEGPTPDI